MGQLAKEIWESEASLAMQGELASKQNKKTAKESSKQPKPGWVWWCTPLTLAFEKQRRADLRSDPVLSHSEFQASQGNTMRGPLQTTTSQTQPNPTKSPRSLPINRRKKNVDRSRDGRSNSNSKLNLWGLEGWLSGKECTLFL